MSASCKVLPGILQEQMKVEVVMKHILSVGVGSFEDGSVKTRRRMELRRDLAISPRV